jgi:methylase of polypeptide subunit release factors
LAAAHDLARQHDFSCYRHLAHVGGGSGGLAIGLARAWPNLSATIVDLPGTTAVAQHHVHEAGLGDRVRVMAADIVNEALPGIL